MAHLDSLHLRHHLYAKFSPLNGGDSQHRTRSFIQRADTLLDHAAHLGRQILPLHGPGGNPTTLGIFHQDSPRLQVAQQFHGKERMAAGVAEQGLPKGRIQPVGFRIEEGIHKFTPGLLVFLAQVDDYFSTLALEFAHHLLEGMALAVTSQRDILGSVAADDQDAASAQHAPQVKEQADGRGVCPVQIVQHQDEGVRFGEGLQQFGILAKETRPL